MAEAGLLLSIASLTFQVFSGCVQGYQLLTEAKHMPGEFQYLRVRLKTEQYRLLDWAHVVQLDESDERLLISNHSKGLLLDVLDQQNKLLQHFGRYDERYKRLRRPLLMEMEDSDGTLHEPPPYSILPAEPKAPGIVRADTDFQSRFPQSEVLLKKSLEWAKNTRSFPRRLAWASWDRTKVETLILKLTAFNDFIVEMLNTSQMQSLAIKQTRTEFQIMQLNSKISQLVQIYESALTLKSSRGRIPTDPLRAFLQARGFEDKEDDKNGIAENNLAALAQFKALNSGLENSDLTDEFTKDLELGNSASEIQSVELTRSSITVIDKESDDHHGESQRVEAYYQAPINPRRKQQVWIEWKSYDPMTYNSGPDDKVHERVKALAALLKKNNRTAQFRAPHCLGYFRDIDATTSEDRCRFGLVFEKPQDVHPSTRPTSLLELLRDQSGDIPSLTDRITLASKIAECIERLHAVNWLHKGLRSSNILFFSDIGTSSSDIEFSSPYISGFDYSRPAQNEDMTEKPPENAASDLYRHPRVQGAGNRDSLSSSSSTSSGGFKKSYDLYALGVILLEIAYWKPIDHVLGIPNLSEARPSTTIKVRKRLLEEGYLKHVKSHLGNTVVDVVRACLEGPGAFGVSEGADERKEDVGAELGRGFYERVVKQLGDMKV